MNQWVNYDLEGSYNQRKALNLFFWTYELNHFLVKAFWSSLYGFLVSIKLFRILFGLPVNGQNGWTTFYSSKYYHNYVYSYKWFYFSFFFDKPTKSIFFAEYFNMYFQSSFKGEWRANRRGLRGRRFQRRFIDVRLLKNIIYIQIFRNRLAKTLSKKKRFKGPTRNLGLKLGFTKKYKRNLIT